MTQTANQNLSSVGLPFHGTAQPAPEESIPVNPAVLLEFKDVFLSYEKDRKTVLQGVDFALKRGESVLFIGPSGCGKSTLAMLCAGLIPQTVEAHVSGEVYRSQALCQQGGVGYVFQNPDAQFCMLQADDEIAFGMENFSVRREEMPKRIGEVLERVGLQEAVDANHLLFSGGMKQKLAIACALAMKPELLILDEPTANLDPLSTQQVFEQVRQLREAGQTLLVIEHKFDALLPYIDRVVLFHANGTIYRSGPTEKIIDEEWDWCVETGVVAPWKQRPQRTGKACRLSFQKNVEEDKRQGEPRPRDEEDCLHPAVILKDATVKYGSKCVWRNLNLTIPEGAFIAVVGMNGVGKSSLLEVIAGLRKLSAGELTVGGQRPNRRGKMALGKTAAFCFQNPEFQFIYERVGDELANRIVGETVPEEIVRILDEFGLKEDAEQSPFALSQGQKRRLSVASMLRENHLLYLLDEPTFGQDGRTQELIMQKMDELHKAGRTIIMTTHDMDLVRRYASHVVVLADEQILFYGSQSDLWKYPDLMQRAHLLADLTVSDTAVSGSSTRSESDETQTKEELKLSAKEGKGINPTWKLVTVIIFSMITIFSNHLSQSVALFVESLLILWLIGRLSLKRTVKRFSPFIAFYLLYVFTFVAYSPVLPGERAIHFLWMNFTLHGLYNGGVLAFRMLSLVGMGIYLLSTTDLTDAVVSLSQNLHVPPKFSYGILAGLRLIPTFRSEWRQLQQARQIRNRDAKRVWMRPVTYALPLLSQSIRMSERVATAMEARGLVGKAAASPKGRSFFRIEPRSWRDPAFLLGVSLFTVALLIFLA